jgi:hypothetical protein
MINPNFSRAPLLLGVLNQQINYTSTKLALTLQMSKLSEPVAT